MPSRRERPWDVVIKGTERRKAIFARRLGTPDGQIHRVTFKHGKRCYPWARLEDGDYFVVSIGDSSERAMKVAFQQGAVRNDMEIVIHRFTTPQGAPFFRVTRVMGDIENVKEKARALGARAPHFDMSAYYRARREERMLARPGRSAPAPRVDAPPTPSPSTGGPAVAPPAYDRAALLAAARKTAQEEL